MPRGALGIEVTTTETIREEEAVEEVVTPTEEPSQTSDDGGLGEQVTEPTLELIGEPVAEAIPPPSTTPEDPTLDSTSSPKAETTHTP